MMDYHLTITLRSDPEIPVAFTLARLFQRLHGVLKGVGHGRIGVSFPHFGKHLGDQMRIHGRCADLESLMAQPWLLGFEDYCRHTGIQTIPKEVGFRNVRRVQAKSSSARLLRRSLRKGWIREDEMAARLAGMPDRLLTDPFVALTSRSNGETFRLFVRHGPLQAQAVMGPFSSYGLAEEATVPWF